MRAFALRSLSIGLLAAFALSGCAGDDSNNTSSSTSEAPPAPVQAMNFTVYNMPAIHQGHGLYEPTIDVSPEGTIYVSSHSTGVGVGPAPGYYSDDDGATWKTLALAGPGATPPGQQGSAPLFSDEIFIVAGANGEAWGVDINLRDYIVTGWCADGAELCYYNPNAYDHTKVITQAAECRPVPAKDRPWAAYSNGTLLMVNNPAVGQVQLAIMRVPPTVPAELGPTASGIEWNLCAATGGFIPGIPDIRPDGFFAVPQVKGGKLTVVTGYATDVMDVQIHTAFNHSFRAAPGSEISDYGQVVFDGDGTMFVGAMENDGDDGSMKVAFSADGSNFTAFDFVRPHPVSSLYLDGNKFGHGALLNWGEVNGTATDWYFGHLFVRGGKVVLENVNRAVEGGPAASRHVQGASLGPDGRAYMVMSEVSGNDDAEMAAAIGTTPLFVVVQTAGPVMPGARVAASAP